MPPGGSTSIVHKVRAEILAAGSPSDVSDADRTQIAIAIADAAGTGIDPSTVMTWILVASMLVIIEFPVPSASAASSAAMSLQASLATPEAATNLLQAASIEVIAAATVLATQERVAVVAPSSPPLAPTSDSGGAGGALIGGSIGGAVLLLVLLRRLCRSKTPPTEEEVHARYVSRTTNDIGLEIVCGAGGGFNGGGCQSPRASRARTGPDMGMTTTTTNEARVSRARTKPIAEPGVSDSKS